MTTGSRLPPCFSLLFGLTLVAGVGTVAFLHGKFVLSDPQILAWIGLSWALGIGLFFLNGAGVQLRAAARWTGFGMVATLGAFALQGIVNGGIVRMAGEGKMSVDLALGLGLWAAVCQTFGKGVAIFVGRRWVRWQPVDAWFALGLGIGLGFGLAEIGLLGIQMMVSAQRVELFWGTLERGSAVAFHLFSGGLIAVAFLRKSIWPVAVVVAMHAALDGISVAFGHAWGAGLLQTVFAAIALTTWFCWWLGARNTSVLRRENVPS